MLTKTKCAALLTAGLVIIAGAALAAPTMNDKEQVSYAIGQQIGSQFKAQGVDVDMPTFARSVEAATKGQPSELTPEQMNSAMMKMRDVQMAKRQKEGEESMTKGKSFLDENKKKPGVKVTASGLQYLVKKDGTGAQPKESDKVRVHYKGTLIDGTEFDSSYKRGQPAEFPLQGVIKGWTEGIPLMKVGSTYTFFIPSDLAYGPQGRPTIPPNSVLVFDVELLDIVK